MTARGIQRRVFLRLLGGGATSAFVPTACTSSTGARQRDGGSSPAVDAGLPDSALPPDAAAETPDGARDATIDRAVAEPPDCIDPLADAGGCQPAPPGRVVGRPCDFAEFRIHAAPHEDEFLAALVGRDASGLYARSARCTHMGCILTEPSALVPEGVKCPCHGSIFDHLGQAWPDQPAKLDLRPLAIALGCDGQLYVDAYTTVDPDFRLEL